LLGRLNIRGVSLFRRRGHKSRQRIARRARAELAVAVLDVARNRVCRDAKALAHLLVGASLGEKPQHVYSVRFTARALWGDEASARDVLYIDLWDDYLDPA